MKKLSTLILMLLFGTSNAFSQVVLDDLMNGNNPVTVTADNQSSVLINVFTAGGGCDGLLVLSIGYTQAQAPPVATNSGISSIQFSSSFLTRAHSASQMIGGIYAFSEIWYAPLGTNVGINSFVDVQFAAVASAIVLNVASYHHVNQSTPIGSVGVNTTSGISSSLVLNSIPGNAVIDNLSSGDTGAIVVGLNQEEISNVSNTNTNGNSFELSSGNSVDMSWIKPNTSTTHVAVELVQSSCPLPVELTAFHGNIREDQINLTWSTANEFNNLGFDIQKSRDGTNWETLAFVNGKAVSKIAQGYAYLDRKPFPGTSYYRLKQIDFDGNYELSEIISFDLSAAPDIQIYPNPVSDEFKIIGFDAAHIKIIDHLGKPILQSNTSDKLINVSTLQAGLYFLQIYDAGRMITRKLIKN